MTTGNERGWCRMSIFDLFFRLFLKYYGEIGEIIQSNNNDGRFHQV